MTLIRHLWILVALLNLSLMQTASAGTQSARKICKTDIDTYCDGVMPGKGRIKACLDEHADVVSTPCKDAMAAAKNACKDDREKFCKDVPEEDGKLIECLKNHKSELSEACQAASKK